MNKLKINKKTITIIIVIIIVLIIAINTIIKLVNRPAKTYGTDIDKSEQTYDDNFRNIINTDTFFNVCNVIKKVEQYLNNSDSSAQREEALYNVLDKNYIELYNIKKKNINEYIDNYIGKKINIKNIQEAQTSGNYSSFLVEVNFYDEKYLGDEKDEYMIVRVDFATLSYSIILPNYFENRTIEDYVLNNLKDDSTIKRNDHNIYDYKVYSNENKLSEYSKMLSNMDVKYIYLTYVGNETKNRYTIDEFEEIYNNENSYFQRPVFVNLSTKNNDNYTVTTYSFKDRKMNEYIITENGIFDFKIDFEFIEEEEPEYIDNGGMLNIIQQN